MYDKVSSTKRKTDICIGFWEETLKRINWMGIKT
jgi:hypothetical protein